MRAHLGLISLLEKAEQLGAELKVNDDSGYWDHRDQQRLFRHTRLGGKQVSVQHLA